MRIDQSRSWSDGVSPRGARAAAAAASVSMCECVCVAPPQEHAGTCSLSLSEGAEPPVCDVTCSRTSPQPEHWTVLLLYCSIYTLLKYNYKSYSVLKTFKAFYFHIHIHLKHYTVLLLYVICLICYIHYIDFIRCISFIRYVCFTCQIRYICVKCYIYFICYISYTRTYVIYVLYVTYV